MGRSSSKDWWTQGRAGTASVEGRRYWVAAERARSFAALFPAAEFEQNLAEVETGKISRDEALLTLVMGWMSAYWADHGFAAWAMLWGLLPQILKRRCCGWKLRERCCGGISLEVAAAERRPRFRSLRLANRSSCARPGRRMRPPTQSGPTQRAETEWCERRLLARIHRLTVGMLRKQIEPITAAAFMRWLLRWQHVAPGSQVIGERGTLEVLRQLQGFEIPANAWERQILSRRIADYDPKWLDQLCMTGAVGWGRLSPHPATLDTGGWRSLPRTERARLGSDG